MGPRCSSTETQVCHRSYIIAAKYSGACIGQHIRKVCRCQQGYRKSYIEEGPAMQWPNEKKDKMINSGLQKTIQKTED